MKTIFEPTGSSSAEVWEQALERTSSDPTGALTSAMSLIETVCKTILDGRKIEFSETADLPKLYTLVTKGLLLHPGDTSDSSLREALSGCFKIVNGLSRLRNKYSDAHGRGAHATEPSKRAAWLAVGMAGLLAAYLIETSDARKIP